MQSHAFHCRRLGARPCADGGEARGQIEDESRVPALLRHASRPERSAHNHALPVVAHRHLRPQACGGPTLSAEKPLVEKRRAAARQNVRQHYGSILTERLGRPTDMPGRRCLLATAPAVRGDAQLSCASGSSGQRGPAARCLACPAEWRSVQGESPAPRGVESEQAAAFEFVRRSLQVV